MSELSLNKEKKCGEYRIQILMQNCSLDLIGYRSTYALGLGTERTGKERDAFLYDSGQLISG